MAVMVDLAMVVVAVVTVVLTVVVELAVAAVATVVVPVVVVVVVMGMVVLIDLLRQVMDMMPAQEQDMATVEGMAMEAILDLGLVLAVDTVALCMEELMAHMAPTVVVPMEGVPTEVVHMEAAPMVVPQVAMVQVDMAVMGEELVEQVVLVVVGVQVLGVLAGIIRMENKC